VPADVPDPDELRLRLTEIAEMTEAGHASGPNTHPRKEVVRRKERQVAAEITVTRDSREHVLRHVLLVAGEDDKVVQRRETVTIGDCIQILVGIEIGAQTLAGEPVDEAAEMLREASLQESAPENNRVDAWVGIPRIAISVAVAVAEI